MENDPERLGEQIMLLRRYAEAYGIYNDRNIELKDKQAPMVKRVRDIDMAIERERRAAAEREGD